ncbi:glutamate--tRNA ligase [Patescibacteria group bacterium]|nr:glutamate--tRNA ligase [Patescibacteria group bacterium]
MKKIRTRFAPSPTGLFHIGNLRTALFNYLFAKKNNGQFILRIEDTDKERSKKEYENTIIESLKWLGLNWDEGPFYQSRRNNIYLNYAKKLLEKNLAYKEGEAIIYKNPKKPIEFEDIIRGSIRFEANTQKDIVLIKSDGSATYNFAVVIDDAKMKVSHIIRGEDHIPNTPKQIPLYKALGFEIPKFCHLPLILGSDKSKMSKRHGAVLATEYKNIGYLPEALMNFLALLGWNPGDERELFSKKELIKNFSLEKIQKAGAIFNIDKLNWYNRQYIKKTGTEELAKMLSDFVPEEWTKKTEIWKKVVDLEKERLTVLSDIKEGIEFFFQKPKYKSSLLKTPQYIDKTIELLSNIPTQNFTKENIKKAVWDYAEANGRGNVLWPFRVALTGLSKSPDPFSVAEILGKEESIKRTVYAKNMVYGNPSY